MADSCGSEKKDTHELVFIAADVGDIHVVRGGTDVFLWADRTTQ